MFFLFRNFESVYFFQFSISENAIKIGILNRIYGHNSKGEKQNSLPATEVSYNLRYNSSTGKRKNFSITNHCNNISCKCHAFTNNFLLVNKFSYSQRRFYNLHEQKFFLLNEKYRSPFVGKYLSWFQRNKTVRVNNFAHWTMIRYICQANVCSWWLWFIFLHSIFNGNFKLMMLLMLINVNVNDCSPLVSETINIK